MRATTRILTTLGLILGATIGGPAIAQISRRAAVLRLEFGERVPEMGRSLLSERLFEGLAANDFQVFAGPVVQNILRKESDLELCREDECYRRAAGRLGVDMVIVGSVRNERRSYELQLDLISGRSGRVLSSKSARCDLCGIAEVGERLKKLVGTLAEGAAADAPPTTRISLQSSPTGATVLVDGKAVGSTPLEADWPAGDHQVGFQATGFRNAELRLSLAGNTHETFHMGLAPEGAAVSQSPAGPVKPLPTLRKIGWGTLIAGGVAFGAGVAFLLMDGRKVGCYEENAQETCIREQRNEFKLQAGLLMGSGAMLMASGGFLLYLSPSPDSAPTGATAIRWVGGVRGTF